MSRDIYDIASSTRPAGRTPVRNLTCAVRSPDRNWPAPDRHRSTCSSRLDPFPRWGKLPGRTLLLPGPPLMSLLKPFKFPISEEWESLWVRDLRVDFKDFLERRGRAPGT